jgi:hypothetical protein
MVFNPATSPQGLYEVSTTQLAPLGAQLFLGDGRVFQYAHNGGTALLPGRLTQAMTTTSADIVDKALSTEVAGSREVTFTPTGTQTFTENQLAGGYFIISDASGAAGAGALYRIDGHAAMAAATAVTLRLSDPLYEAIAAADTGTVIPHPCQDVIISGGPVTAPLTGIPIRDVPIANYCWLQTKGIAPCLADGVVVVGNIVATSDGVAGACQPIVAGGAEVDEIHIGECQFTNATTDIVGMNLRL